MSGALHDKVSVTLVDSGDQRFIDHTGVLRFLVESEDLLQATISRSYGEETLADKKIKKKAPEEIRRRRTGAKIECGQRFILRNVQHGLYLAIRQSKPGELLNAWGLELSDELTQNCLLRVKSTADLKSPGAYMKYDFPMLVSSAATADFSYYLSIQSGKVCVQEDTLPWRFQKFKKCLSATDSDNFVTYLEPVRIKLKCGLCRGSSYYLSAKSLIVNSGEVDNEDTKLILTPDADSIGTHFAFVCSSDTKGGQVEGSAKFYIIQAANLSYLTKNLCFEKYHSPEFQCCINSIAPGVPVSFNIGVQLSFGGEGELLKLGIDKKLKELEAISLAVTFDKDNIESTSLGRVVLEHLGSQFEIEAVSPADTLLYQGFAAILELSTQLLEEIERIMRDGAEGMIEEWTVSALSDYDIELILGWLEQLLDPLRTLKFELANSGLEKFIAKQEVLVEIGIPTNLLKLCVLFSTLMSEKWKKKSLLLNTQTIRNSSSAREDFEDSYVSDSCADSSEGDTVTETQSAEDDEESDAEESELERRLRRRSRSFFDESLEVIFDCIKLNLKNCKIFIAFDQQLHQIYGFNRQLVGSILAEMYTYAFPNVDNVEDYYYQLVQYFSDITQENIKDQHLFTRILRILMGGDTYESDLFHNYCYQVLMQGNPDILSYKFAKTEGRLWVTFEIVDSSCTYDDQIRNNPILGETNRREIEGRVYFAVDQINDHEYLEYIRQCMLYSCAFKDSAIGKNLQRWNNVTSTLLADIINMPAVPLAIKYGAVITYDRLLSLLRSKKNRYIFNLSAPRTPGYNSNDLVRLPPESANWDRDRRELALQDLRHAARMTLHLASSAQTVSLFPPAGSLVEQLRFATGLLRLGHRLIAESFATREYIRLMLGVVKVALAQISKRPDLPTSWFTEMIAHSVKLSHKDFPVKNSIESLYEWVFRLLSVCIRGSVEAHFEYFVEILRQPYSAFKAKQDFTWDSVIQRVLNEIAGPLEVFIWEKGQVVAPTLRRTLSPVAVSPLPAGELFDKEMFYSLSEFRFFIAIPMLDILDGLFLESESFGINFDRKLVDALKQTVNLRETIESELRKLIIVDDSSAEILNVVDNCSLNLSQDDVSMLSFGSSEGRIEGVTRVTETIKQHPFLNSASMLQSKDGLKVLQMITSLNQDDLDFFAYFFLQLREIEADEGLTQEQQIVIHSARAVSMKFLLAFIKDSTPGKKAVAKWLKPSDMAFLIPEVAEFALEFADFDYLSTQETQIVFGSLKANLHDSDYWKAHITYKFMQIIAEDSESEAQHLVVSSIGEDVKGPLKQMAEKKKLSEEDVRYIELSLMFLSDCSRVNRTAREQVVNLFNLAVIHELFAHYKEEYSLLLAFLTFIDKNFRKNFKGETKETSEFRRMAMEIVESVLGIALSILSGTQELLGVIRLNVYREVPHNTVVMHSGLRLPLSPQQLNTLAKLRFLFWQSSANEYGVLAAVPNIMRRIVKDPAADKSSISRFLVQLKTIKHLIGELKDQDFDFSLLHGRANRALQTANLILTSGVTKKSQQQDEFGNRESSSMLKASFTEKLESLFPPLVHVLKTNRLVDSLAARIQELLSKDLARAEDALATLYRRRPQFPLKTFCRVLVRISKGAPYVIAKNLLKLLVRNHIIFSLFSTLGDALPLRTNIAVLWALNSILRNQHTLTILKLKDALVDRSLDVDILVAVQKEMRQALETYRHRERGDPLTLYINSLGYLRYQTYADDSRRRHMVDLHQRLVVLLMKLMQRFCDNCNEPMQEYVRVQSKDSAFNINLVVTTTDFLVNTCMLTRSENLMNPQTLTYLATAINTLIEFATGPCKANQGLIGSKIPLYLGLNKLLQQPPDHYYDFSSQFRSADVIELEDQVTDLRAAVTKLLQTLLEGSPEKELLEIIDKYLDKRKIIDHAKRIYGAFFHNHRRIIEVEMPSASHSVRKVKTVLEEVCFLISFLQKMSTPLSRVLVTEEDRAPFRNFYLYYVGYVEIDMSPETPAEAKSSDDIRDVFFVVPFKVKFLPRVSAEEVITEVSHESLQERKEGILKSVSMRKREMEHHQRIARRPCLQFFISQSYNLKLTSFVLVIVINIALFVYDDKSVMEKSTLSTGVEIVFVLILGILQLVCNIFGSMLNSVNHYTKIVDKYTAEDEGMDFEDLASADDRESQRAIYLKMQKEEEVKPVASHANAHRQILKGPPAEWQALVLYEENTVALIYLAASVLAIVYPMLYPLLLLQIFDHVSQLRVILQAITYNKSQLIYTALFGVHLLLLFSIICFVWFSNYFTGSADPGPIVFCDSLWDCFTSTVHWGLLSGGGIGDAMGSATAGRYWGRLVFDLIFFIVIIIIMLNIIFGIIIDTFGELREKRNAIAEDINSFCFVCGVDRNEIELHGKGWAYHFQNEHSPYAYLAFFVYLTDMKIADCSGVEKYAKQKLEKTDISFLPDTSKMLLQNKVK